MIPGVKPAGIGIAVLMVAALGVASASTASAAPMKPTITGTTEVTVPTEFVTEAAGQGVVVSAIEPATALATSTSVAIQFPVTGPVGDGIIRHRGGLSFASENTGITIEIINPSLTWGTGPSPVKRAQVTFTNAINGNLVTFFDVRNIDMTGKAGKPEKHGRHGWKRTDTGTFAGDLFVVNNPLAVKAFNEVMDAEILTPGAAFGEISSTYSTTVYCKTKKLCQR